TRCTRPFLTHGALSLRTAKASPFRCDLSVRAAKSLVISSDVDRHSWLLCRIGVRVGVWTTAHRAQIKLFGLPGLSVLGIELGIRCCFESFFRDDTGSLVVAMPIAGSARKPRHNDFGAKLPDHTYVVTENLVVTPFFQGLLRCLRKTEIEVRCKE